MNSDKYLGLIIDANGSTHTVYAGQETISTDVTDVTDISQAPH